MNFTEVSVLLGAAKKFSQSTADGIVTYDSRYSYYLFCVGSQAEPSPDWLAYIPAGADLPF